MQLSEISEYFANVVHTKQISHAYLLEGEAGSRGMQLIGEFAARLQCENGDYCGTCHSCLAYASGNHPDIIRVRHEKPDSIGVDEIRTQLVNDITIKPYSSPYKIYLVEDAEKLTVQAQNALLKTMEEPPHYGIVILFTDNAEKMLPTILSRSILLKLQDEVGILSIPEEDREMVLSVLRKVKNMTVTQMADTAKTFKERKIKTSHIMDVARTWYRDLLVWKSTGDQDLLMLGAEQFYYQGQAEEMTYLEIDLLLQGIEITQKRISSNVNYELAVELMLMAMKQ